jgi:hypothetical protein
MPLSTLLIPRVFKRGKAYPENDNAFPVKAEAVLTAASVIVFAVVSVLFNPSRPASLTTLTAAADILAAVSFGDPAALMAASPALWSELRRCTGDIISA